MSHPSTTPAPWEVFFSTFTHMTEHLPQLTATGMRLRPDSPAQRALDEATRRALHAAWKVHGEPYAHALAVSAGLSGAALAWLRQDGVDREALRAQLAAFTLETRAEALAGAGGDDSDDEGEAWAAD